MLYDNLPVFKAAYDLLIEVYGVCGQLAREYRYTLAERLKTEITELMLSIYRANLSSDKQAGLNRARELLVTIKLYVRLLHDLQQINLKRYALLADKCESISKQLTAWARVAAKEKGKESL